MFPNLSRLSLSARGARTDASYDPRYADALSVRAAIESILTIDGQSLAAARRASNLEAVPWSVASGAVYDVQRGVGWRNPDKSAVIDSVMFRFQSARTPKGPPFFGGVFELRCSVCNHLGGRSVLTLHSTGSMGDYDDDEFQEALRRFLPADPLPIAVSVNRVSNNLQLYGMKTARAKVIDRIVKAVTELLSEPVEEDRVESEELLTPSTVVDPYPNKAEPKAEPKAERKAEDDEAAATDPGEASVTEVEEEEAALTEAGSDV